MTTVFLDAVFRPFFKIVHDTGQKLAIDRTNFLTDGFLQIIQRTGFVSECSEVIHPQKDRVTTRNRSMATNVEMPPQEPLDDRDRLATFNKRVVHKHAVLQQAKSPLLLKWPIQRKRMPTTSPPPPAYLLSTTHSKDVRFPWVTLYKRSHATLTMLTNDGYSGIN